MPCHRLTTRRRCSPEEETLPTITRLYPTLELFSDGEPPQHTLFVMGRGVGPGSDDELLLVDPPLNAAQLFALPARAAALFTGATSPVEGLALVQTEPGGLAHLRIGEHLLDVYSQAQSNVVLLPRVGVLCGGRFGSDVTLPTLVAGSDAQPELDVLRLLAMLVRERKVQLFIPHKGAVATDRAEIMQRLADDVGYLHELRRVVPSVVQSRGGLSSALALAETLLPVARRTPANQARHAANITALYITTENLQN